MSSLETRRSQVDQIQSQASEIKDLSATFVSQATASLHSSAEKLCETLPLEEIVRRMDAALRALKGEHTSEPAEPKVAHLHGIGDPKPSETPIVGPSIDESDPAVEFEISPDYTPNPIELWLAGKGPEPKSPVNEEEMLQKATQEFGISPDYIPNPIEEMLHELNSQRERRPPNTEEVRLDHGGPRRGPRF